MSERIFIGVAWPYANGPLHLGHIAGAYLAADIFARYHRIKGNEVLMVSGSDQHGTPITITAEQEGKKPEEIAARYHQQFLDSWQKLGVSFDLFTNTGTANHAEVVQDIFRTLLDKGHIYRDTVSQPFCDDCQRTAWAEGLDLKATRQRIQALLATPERTAAFVRALLDPLAPGTPDPDPAALHVFLDFRARSVTRLVQAVADVVHAAGLAVGLDCFSPALAPLVGQDLGALNAHCEWIKIIAYGHTLGPASLPFELLGLADWLVDERSVNEPMALEWLSLATRLPLPSTRAVLRERGLAPEALAAETQRGQAAGVSPLLAGIELVADILHFLNQRQRTLIRILERLAGQLIHSFIHRCAIGRSAEPAKRAAEEEACAGCHGDIQGVVPVNAGALEQLILRGYNQLLCAG